MIDRDWGVNVVGLQSCIWGRQRGGAGRVMHKP